MTALLFSCLWLVAPAFGPVSDTRELIERALDEPTTITLEQVPLREAIDLLTQQTGVRIEMAPEVMALVPHGGETVVQHVAIADVPLRQGLTQLFAPLGMKFVVGASSLQVVPRDALRCLGRKPTWAELDTLATLAATEPGIDPAALARLSKRVQFTMAAPDGWEILAQAIQAVGAGPGDETLTIACERIGWAWCVSGDRIVITSMADLIRNQLQRPISLRMNSRALVDVLQEVGDKAYVAVRAEPGALASLPMHIQRNFSLNAANSPAERVLEKIAAYTGLGYLIEPDGVLFYRVGENGRAATDDGPTKKNFAADPYVGKIVVPLADGTSVEWHIRRSELPEDLRLKREADLKKAFDALRRQVIEGE